MSLRAAKAGRHGPLDCKGRVTTLPDPSVPLLLPLAGVRVLDLSNVLAGPFCGYNLARLGAEVIKIENPDGGDLARKLGADPAMAARLMGLSFVAVNAGKQSVALDLKAKAGKEAFLRLLDQADVVLENFRPGVMERLGLSYDVLAARNPRIVYCAISGFGQDGPWASRPAASCQWPSRAAGCQCSLWKTETCCSRKSSPRIRCCSAPRVRSATASLAPPRSCSCTARRRSPGSDI